MKRKVTILLDKDLKDYTGLGYSYSRAFEKCGYEANIVAFHINKRMYKLLKFIPFLEHAFLRSEQGKVLDTVLKDNSELIFVSKGSYLFPDTVQKIKNNNKTIICFNPDDPFSSVEWSSNSYITESIGLYDAYFIWDRKLIPKLEQCGCEHVYYLPFAADTDIMKYRAPGTNGSNKESYAVSFIGNIDEEREGFITELANKITDVKEKKALYGWGWNNIEGFECNKPAIGAEYLESIYRTKINLNILRNQNKSAHNMRTFEVPASGGFLLHEYSPTLEEFFKEGVEMEFYRDIDECADKIKYYLKNGEQRLKIARAGYERVLESGYTYDGLVKSIEEKLGGITNSNVL